MSPRLKALKAKATKRFIAFVMIHCSTLRVSYSTLIAERNALRRDLDALEARHTPLMDAASRFNRMLDNTHTQRPGSIQLVIADEPLALAFKTKLNNLVLAVEGKPLTDDPFFDLPVSAGPSRRMH